MKRLPVLVTLLAMTGCSLQVKQVHLELPDTTSVASTRQIIIESVTDYRDFSVAPESNQPRLKSSIQAALGPDRQRQAVAGTPQAPFVEVLADEKTVSAEMRDLIVRSLSERGYTVISSDKAPPGTPRLKIDVTEFWGTIPFNFFRAAAYAQQMKVWIATTMHIDSGEGVKTFKVSGYGSNVFQIINEDNWRITFKRAMTDYKKNLQAEMF